MYNALAINNSNHYDYNLIILPKIIVIIVLLLVMLIEAFLKVRELWHIDKRNTVSMLNLNFYATSIWYNSSHCPTAVQYRSNHCPPL